jgi:hypothetical protein
VGRCPTRLAAAEIYWLCTVRPEGRPHVTPLIAVWQDGALVFCTGVDECKASNLAANPACTLTTGTNALNDGTDLVVEGSAIRVTDSDRLHAVSDAYGPKYGSDWHFKVADDALLGAGDRVRGRTRDGLRLRQGRVQPDPLAILTGHIGVW